MSSFLLLSVGSRELGLGHLVRAGRLAQHIKNHTHHSVVEIARADNMGNGLNLDSNRKDSKDIFSALLEDVKKFTYEEKFDFAVLDLPFDRIGIEFISLVKAARKIARYLVAIDRPLGFINQFFWPPGEPVPPNVVFGWDRFITEPKNVTLLRQDSADLIVATGGSDLHDLGEIWPGLIAGALQAGQLVDWVSGPYARNPRIPENSEIKFRVLTGVTDIPKEALASQAQIALCVYGVTFFELLALGIPTVVYLPEGAALRGEAEQLAAAEVAVVARDPMEAIWKLGELDRSLALRSHLKKNMGLKIRGGEGPERFLSELSSRFSFDFC